MLEYKRDETTSPQKGRTNYIATKSLNRVLRLHTLPYLTLSCKGDLMSTTNQRRLGYIKLSSVFFQDFEDRDLWQDCR